MPRLLDQISSSATPLLWLDDTAYADALLAQGRTPWLDGAEYVAFRRKAQGLLRPDVVVVPVGAFAHAWVGAHPELREVMAAKKRAGVPARVLLGDEALRAHLVDVVRGLRAAFASAPLVLALPSPRAFVGDAYRLAHGVEAEVEVGGDEADACAVYVAEFLRSFGECGVDALLLEEDANAEAANAEELGWYQPVINVAGHYRWDLGVQWPSGEAFVGEVRDLQFVIAPRVLPGAACGVSVSEAFWSGADAPSVPAGGFRFARVPAQAVPEAVLEHVQRLRR